MSRTATRKSTQTVPATPVMLAAPKPATLPTPDMTVAQLRTMATDAGVIMPAKPSKASLIALINQTLATKATPATKATKTPATKTPATKTPATKGSPVRKDVKPADVTPDPHTPEENARIAELEGFAATFVAAGKTAAERLANTLVQLVPLKPWAGKKLGNGHPVSVAAYFSALGNRLVATDQDARRIVVRALGNTVSIETVIDVTGSSPRTIQRDRIALGLASEARVKSHAGDGKNGSKTVTKTPATKTNQPVTTTDMVPVLSMTSVRAFIGELDDVDMLEELAELIAERKNALAR